jgi:hypothetical protein
MNMIMNYESEMSGKQKYSSRTETILEIRILSLGHMKWNW